MSWLYYLADGIFFCLLWNEQLIFKDENEEWGCLVFWACRDGVGLGSKGMFAEDFLLWRKHSIQHVRPSTADPVRLQVDSHNSRLPVSGIK